MEGVLSLRDEDGTGALLWSPFLAQLSHTGALSFTPTTFTTDPDPTSLAIDIPTTATGLDRWPTPTLGFNILFKDDQAFECRCETMEEVKAWTASIAAFITDEQDMNEATEYAVEHIVDEEQLLTSIASNGMNSLNSSIDLSDDDAEHHATRPPPAPNTHAQTHAQTHEATAILNSYTHAMSNLPPPHTLPPRMPTTSPRTSPARHSRSTSNKLNSSALSLLGDDTDTDDDSPGPPGASTTVPTSTLLNSIEASRAQKTALSSLRVTMSEMSKSHADSISALQAQKDTLAYQMQSLDAKLSIESERRKSVESVVGEITEVKDGYRNDLHELQGKVAKYESEVVSTKLASVQETTDVISTATAGIEVVLRKEREERVRERRGLEVAHANEKHEALARQRESLRRQFAVEKAVALAEATEAANNELHEMKMRMDDKWRKKFDKLSESSKAKQLQTTRDVKQLTALHTTHVAALEKAVADEASRLKIAREQNKVLTIGRASDAARNAADRETEAKMTAASLRQVEEMRVNLGIVEGEKADVVKKFLGLKGEAGRMSDDKRLSEARIQGVKARLAEAEAECVALTRELQEVRVESRGGGELAELLRKENAILRRKGEGLEMQLKRMRDCLMSVNQHIYGAKAAEMCRRVAEGEGGVRGRGGAFLKDGYGDKVLHNLTNREAAKGGSAKRAAGAKREAARASSSSSSRSKPFV